MSDQQIYLELFKAISRKARKGKPDRVSPVNFVLQNYHGWDQSRIDRTIRELVDAGELAQSASALHFIPKLSDGTIPIAKDQGPIVNCAYCKRKLKPKDQTRDHVFPRSRGGVDDSSNIVIACRSCNEAKGDLTIAEWAKSILHYDRPRRYQSRFTRAAQHAFVSLLLIVATLKGGA